MPKSDTQLALERAHLPAMAKESLSIQAYNAIRKQLIIGSLKPGQKLLLRSVASELSISVTPVREALLRLVAEQVLATDAVGTVHVPYLTEDRYIEIRNLRAELEPRAAVGALMHVGSTVIVALEAMHEQIVDAIRAGDFASAQLLNERLHFTLYEAANMPILQKILEGLWAQIGPLMRLFHEQIDENMIAGHIHYDLFRALRAKDEYLVFNYTKFGIVRYSDILTGIIRNQRTTY